jgi:acyl-CoA oxidase
VRDRGTVTVLLGELRPHVVMLVDDFAIPQEWKAAAILEEEAGRQEAMHLEDTAAGAGSAAPVDTPTSLDVPPGP